jgi:hypothetical protein
MNRWPGVVLRTLTLTTCTTVRVAYHTGARAVLTAREAEVQHHQPGSAPEDCSSGLYRLPIVTRMTVPTAIVGGVLLPAHQTSVVLRPGARVPEDGGTPTPGCRPLQEGR